MIWVIGCSFSIWSIKVYLNETKPSDDPIVCSVNHWRGLCGLVGCAVTLEEANEYMDRESLSYGDDFREMPENSWAKNWKTDNGEKPFKVLRSRKFLVQVFRQPTGIIRITINRTRLKAIGRWEDGITWDEIQKIKTQIGYSHRDAVEVYPKDEDIVDVANMRHIWVLPEHQLNFIWRSKK